MKKTIAVWLSMAALLILPAGCHSVSRSNVPTSAGPSTKSAGGLTLRIDFGNAGRSVQAKAADVDHLSVWVGVPGMSAFLKRELGKDALATSMTFPELPVGRATVKATAFNSLGLIIGSEQVEADIEAGENKDLELKLGLMPDAVFFEGDAWDFCESTTLFFGPHGIAFDPSDNRIAYLTNTLDHGVLKVDEALATCSVWLHNGKGSGEAADDAEKRFVYPSALKSDRQGNLYVLDDNRNRAFSSSDEFGYRIRKISEGGGTVSTVYQMPVDGAPAFISDLRDIALDPSGKLYSLNNRLENGVESTEICRISDGQATSLFVANKTIGYKIAVDGQGVIYLACQDKAENRKKLLKIDEEGAYLLAEGEFRALVLNGKNELFAYRSESDRLYKFSADGWSCAASGAEASLTSLAIDEVSGVILAVSPAFSGIYQIE